MTQGIFKESGNPGDQNELTMTSRKYPQEDIHSSGKMQMSENVLIWWKNIAKEGLPEKSKDKTKTAAAPAAL